MRIALIYLLFGIVWILFSDALVLGLSRDPEYLTSYQNYKGLFFVGLSALLIFLLDKAEAQHRAKAAQALRESEEMFRSTFNSAAIGMAHLAPQGHFLRVNPQLCRIFGYSQAELLSGMTFQQITHADDLPRSLALVQRLLSGTMETAVMEKRYQRKDGSWIWSGITVSLLRAETGEPRYFICTVEDITERRQISEELTALTATLDHRVWQRTAQLAEANRDLESFSYSVSHDLRAPLRAISGFAQILKRRYHNAWDERGQEYLQYIMQAAERMNQLIDDLLVYSRLGRQAVRQQDVALDDVLQTVLSDLAPKIAETQASIEIQSPLPIVQGDTTLLHQLFINLMDNALKYQRPGIAPRIEIWGLVQGQWVEVRVADNGPGIAPEQHEKIFHVFQRLHSEEDFPGTGIGLAIVAKSVSLLKGHVRVESRPDGASGSVFVICLPVAANCVVP